MPTFHDLSFSPLARPLLEQPGSFAHLPGVHDPHGDGLPRWSVERITTLKTVLRVRFRHHPEGDAPGPCHPDLPRHYCKSTCAHT